MIGDQLDILLVEDDRDTCANLADILEIDGHNVRLAGTAAEARVHAANQSICLVILDRKLPDATADTLLPELKRMLPNAEIIVVTGYADMDSTIAAFRQGAADYVLKPINPEALRQSVDRIVKRRRIEQELAQEHRFSDQILSTAEAVVLVLDLDGRIVRFNPYFEQISGWKLTDVKGKDWFVQCLPERDRDHIRDVFNETAFEVNTSGIINPIVTTEGTERQIRWSNTTLKDEHDKTYSILAVGVDATELLAAQEDSIRKGRLAAIGQTMTALAHESRNALQRMQASLDLLELEVGENSEARQDIDSLIRAKNDLRDLLEGNPILRRSDPTQDGTIQFASGLATGMA